MLQSKIYVLRGHGLPGFMEKFSGRFALDDRVTGVRKLSGWMVAPDDDVLHVLNGHAALPGDLGHGAVLSGKTIINWILFQRGR